MSAVRLQIQSVLYNNSVESVWRSKTAIRDAVNYAQSCGIIDSAVLSYGDSSPIPVLDSEIIAGWNTDAGLSVRYTYFNQNMGSAGGQNLLAQGSDADFIFLINPDIIPTRNIFEELLRPFTLNSEVGITECKQLPVEHPKDFNRETGETSWALGSCTFIKRSVFEKVGGYDSENFFLYCDDVDLSWRVRLAGFRIIFVPNAAYFHDKRFGSLGEWLPGDPEVYYSAEAAMLMAYKWSYFSLLEEIILDHERSDNPLHQKAVMAIKKRMAEGNMPKPLDMDHKIGEIINRNYGKMRFVI